MFINNMDQSLNQFPIIPFKRLTFKVYRFYAPKEFILIFFFVVVDMLAQNVWQLSGEEISKGFICVVYFVLKINGNLVQIHESCQNIP